MNITQILTGIKNWCVEKYSSTVNTLAKIMSGETSVPLSLNLKSWAERQLTPNTPSAMVGVQVRTTGGDISLDSSVNALLSSIVATSLSFTPDWLIATGRNLLRLQSNNGLALKGAGNWWYIPVPHLVFAGYGAHGANNGIILTDKDGNCITSATVYYKAFSTGVPTSATDGTAATYSTANGIRFYTTPDEGWLIISGITYAETCAHMAWSISAEYDFYISPTDANDAGTKVDLSALGTMRKARTVADKAERTSDTTMLLTTNVGSSNSLEWNTTEETDSESQPTGNYIHTAEIGTIKSDGEAIILRNNVADYYHSQDAEGNARPEASAATLGQIDLLNYDEQLIDMVDVCEYIGGQYLWNAYNVALGTKLKFNGRVYVASPDGWALSNNEVMEDKTLLSLTVNGSTVSYVDGIPCVAPDTQVNFELATPTTASKNVATSVKVNDMGIEALVGTTGTSILTMLYAQGMADSLAALVAQINPEQSAVLALALCQMQSDIDGLKAYLQNMGAMAAQIVESRDGYTIMGQKLYDECEGAPQEPTKALGLIRYDKTNEVFYCSIAAAADYSGWKLI